MGVLVLRKLRKQKTGQPGAGRQDYEDELPGGRRTAWVRPAPPGLPLGHRRLPAVLFTAPPTESRAPLRKWDYILSIEDRNKTVAAHADGTVFYLPEGRKGCFMARTSGRVAATTAAVAPANLLLVGQSCDKNKVEEDVQIGVATDPEGGTTTRSGSDRNVSYRCRRCPSLVA
jgi:hypothetical protein